MLLYAQSNDFLSLGRWCERSTFGAELQLLGRAGVRLWENITEFPKTNNLGSLDGQVQLLVERFVREREDAGNDKADAVNGVIFQSTDLANTAGDVCGLFLTPSGSYELLVIQCKNWYGTTVRTATTEKEMHLVWKNSTRVFRSWKHPHDLAVVADCSVEPQTLSLTISVNSRPAVVKTSDF
jgi:hypothetical protein